MPAVRIVAFKGQYRITLPKDLVKDKGWGAGTELRFIEDESRRVCLKPISVDGDAVRGKARRRGA